MEGAGEAYQEEVDFDSIFLSESPRVLEQDVKINEAVNRKRGLRHKYLSGPTTSTSPARNSSKRITWGFESTSPKIDLPTEQTSDEIEGGAALSPSVSDEHGGSLLNLRAGPMKDGGRSSQWRLSTRIDAKITKAAAIAAVNSFLPTPAKSDRSELKPSPSVKSNLQEPDHQQQTAPENIPATSTLNPTAQRPTGSQVAAPGVPPTHSFVSIALADQHSPSYSISAENSAPDSSVQITVIPSGPGESDSKANDAVSVMQTPSRQTSLPIPSEPHQPTHRQRESISLDVRMGMSHSISAVFHRRSSFARSSMASGTSHSMVTSPQFSQVSIAELDEDPNAINAAPAETSVSPSNPESSASVPTAWALNRVSPAARQGLKTPPDASTDEVKGPAIRNLNRESSEKRELNESFGFSKSGEEPKIGIGGLKDSGAKEGEETVEESTNGFKRRMSAILLPTKKAPRSPHHVQAALSAARTESPKLVLDGKVHPWTQTFLEQELEEGYRAYSFKRSKAMWRMGAAFHLLRSIGIAAYHLSIYPRDAAKFEAFKVERSSQSNLQSCNPGYACLPCEPGKLCGEYSIALDGILLLIGCICPFAVEVLFPNLINPASSLVQHSHTIAGIISLLDAAIISLRHYLIEPKTTPFKTSLFYVMNILGTLVFLRIRFYNALIISPIFLLIYSSEALLANNWNDPLFDSQGLALGIFSLFVAILILIAASYDHERNYRSQYVRSRSYLDANANLIGRLEDLSRNYKTQVADFESPLEKAIASINQMRADHELSHRHYTQMGHILTFLNSSDLMTPDIRKQLHGGLTGLDEEGEKWLYSNLYRGGTAGNRRRSTIDPKEMTQSPSMTAVSEETRKVSFIQQGDQAKEPEAKTAGLYTDSRFKRPLPPRHGSVNVMSTDAKRRLSTVATASLPFRKHTNLQRHLSLISTNEWSGDVASSLPSVFGDLSFSETGDLDDESQADRDISPKKVNASPSVQHIPNVDENSMTKRAVDAACTDPSPQPASSSVTTSNHSSAGHIASPPNDLEDPTRSVSDSEKIVELLESADSWNWDLFTMDTATSGRPLITLSHFLFLRSNLYAILHIPVEKFLKFVEAIESGYHREVPYHNALHATDVLHGVSYLLASCEEVVPMGDLELMALYTAAVIHDYNHPGKNNNFLVNTLDEMALLYNDRSVLENHHLSTAFRVLIQTEHNFLQHLCRDDFKQVRELIIELVLATDLQTQHFAILSMFKNKVALSKAFDPYNNDEDRNLLWKMIIKCADVSNPTKAMPLYTQWTERVLQEFFLQGDAERAAGLPISPYYDRDTISVPNSQIGFIEFICLPLFEAFDAFYKIPIPLEGIRSNRNHWIKQRDEAQQQQQQHQQPQSNTTSVPKTPEAGIPSNIPHSPSQETFDGRRKASSVQPRQHPWSGNSTNCVAE